MTKKQAPPRKRTDAQRDFDWIMKGWAFAGDAALPNYLARAQEAYTRIGFEDAERRERLDALRSRVGELELANSRTDPRVATLSQMFWDGRLSTSKFDLTDSKQRTLAAEWLIAELDKETPRG